MNTQDELESLSQRVDDLDERLGKVKDEMLTWDKLFWGVWLVW